MKFAILILKGILNLIYIFFKLLPVKNKVTIISRQSDQKTLDIELLEGELKKRTGITVVCLCRTMNSDLIGMIKYIPALFKQMYHIATSKVVVLDGYCIGVSFLRQRKSLYVIQMWHALGSLKKFGYSIFNKEEGRSTDFAKFMNMHEHYSLILSSSDACADNFAEAFNYRREDVAIESLPRVDVILDKDKQTENAEKIFKQYPKLKEKKNIVYAPTFRKNKEDNIDALNNLMDAVDYEQYNLIIKLHPLMDTNIERDNVIVDTSFSSLEMFAVADYIILDYSAIVYEAALMKKPLFFYAFDLDKYKTNRDFYVDYETEMPGVVSDDIGDIIAAIKDNNYNLDDVKTFANKYIEIQKNCTVRIADRIGEYIY